MFHMLLIFTPLEESDLEARLLNSSLGGTRSCRFCVRKSRRGREKIKEKKNYKMEEKNYICEMKKSRLWCEEGKNYKRFSY
jgi:hypothetical protein